jgi:hypothetical protein
MAGANASIPSARTEYVRLPDAADMPPPGESWRYDAQGRRTDDGNVIITNYGVQFVWLRFQEQVLAGQIATMVVSNLFTWIVGGPEITAACVMDGAATEWDMSTNGPTISDAVIELISVERGMGVGRVVCRNTYDADLWVAAGIAAPIALFLPPG